jgi:branched-chain amino acid transport system ATP-binding protein
VALLGRNGARTLVRSIVGFTPPRAGRVALAGAPIHRLPAYRVARLGIGLVPQGRRIFAPLSVTENLVFAERPAPGAWTRERVYDLPRAPRARGAGRRHALGRRAADVGIA